MLIVRELALGPRRFTDLRGDLPGIATNLLADRLRFLETAGLVERHEVASPLPGVLYRLAPRGEALVPVLRELARWGTPLMLEGQGDDACQSRWLVFMAEIVYADVATDGIAPLTVSLSTGEETVTIRFETDGVRIEPGASSPADLSIEAEPDTLFALLTGDLTFDEAKTRGAVLTGSPPARRRLATMTARVGLLPPRSSR